VLVSSYSYCTPKLSPLLARHQQQWAKAYLGSTNSLIPVRRPLHGACTIQALLSLRRQCCATPTAHYFHPSNVRPPRCEPASLGESERLGTQRERDTGPKHTHTTHATPLHQHLLSALSTRPSCTPAALRPPASPFRCTTLNRADSHALTRLARVVRRRIPLHPSRVPADARTAHADTPTLAFHRDIEPVASGRKIEEPPIGDAEDCIRWTPGLEAWRILKSHAFVNPRRNTAVQSNIVYSVRTNGRVRVGRVAPANRSLCSCFGRSNSAIGLFTHQLVCLHFHRITKTASLRLHTLSAAPRRRLLTCSGSP
jgi:hypothetical protein